MTGGTYSGDVCYVDGWHMTVEQDENGSDVPGERLVLSDDGTYAIADSEADSWFDRKHTAFAVVVPDGGGSGRSVSAEQFSQIEQFLNGTASIVPSDEASQ